MRSKILAQSTFRQSQVTPVTTINQIENDPRHSIQQATTITQSRVEQNTKETKFKDQLILHHSYENRFRSVKRGLHEVHKEIFSQSATKNVQMMVGNRKRRNATHDLIRKQPQQSLLKNKPPHSTQLIADTRITTIFIDEFSIPIGKQSKRKTIATHQLSINLSKAI